MNEQSSSTNEHNVSMSKLKIIAIVPTYNGWKILNKCLKSLEQQTLPLKEIIVVVNGSTDGSENRLLKTHPEVKIIKLKKNTGVTGGRNAGIKSITSPFDYLLFFDHDMVADKKMVEKMVMADRGKVGGILTPKIFYQSDKNRIWSAGTGINLWTGQVLFRGGNDNGQYERLEEVQVAPAAMLVKNEVMNQIKGFDNKYFATYEDTDFCFRARKKGFKIFYVPKAAAYHDLTTDPVEESIRLLNRAYWVGRNRVLFMKDFGNNFAVFLLFLPVFGFYYLQLSVRYNKPSAFYQFLKGTINGLRGI